MVLDVRKPVFRSLRKTKAQTSLRIGYVIRLLGMIISKLAASEISLF